MTAGVLISNDVVLTGNSEDTYIFQVLSTPPGSNSAPIEVLTILRSTVDGPYDAFAAVCFISGAQCAYHKF